MVFRLLYRLLLQRLDREAKTVSGAHRPANGASRPSRRTAQALMLALGAAALATVVLMVVVLPAVQKQAGGRPAALALNIPALAGARPRACS